MSEPTLEEAREVSEWRPELGVLSIYLGFDPADRGGAWRTELRNALDTVLESHRDSGHDLRVALRATAKRLTERFEDGDLRPPPRGEVGFVEVAEKEGVEHWWGTGAPPVADGCVEYASEPAVAPLIALVSRGGARGVALVSAERVRLLRCTAGALEELENWELSLLSLDWRERKSQSTNNPARAQGVSASGHDQYDERLEHNRHRFLTECGQLAGRALEKNGIAEAIVFGPAKDAEAFEHGFNAAKAKVVRGSDADLISIPTGQLNEVVTEAIARLDGERDRTVVERALGEAKGGSRGSAGIQETKEALAEGRVDHLVFDGALNGDVESLLRAAFASSASVTIVHDELAEPLAQAEGVAAILRY
ncbi:MAG TPA: VLRF1 family aeRF1-type release factor [Solirubrobacterales bacterium]|nr:VLRF1 family aeRF1-type release factor [Solirubrobacterales bacterium]